MYGVPYLAPLKVELVRSLQIVMNQLLPMSHFPTAAYGGCIWWGGGISIDGQPPFDSLARKLLRGSEWATGFCGSATSTDGMGVGWWMKQTLWRLWDQTADLVWFGIQGWLIYIYIYIYGQYKRGQHAKKDQPRDGLLTFADRIMASRWDSLFRV